MNITFLCVGQKINNIEAAAARVVRCFYAQTAVTKMAITDVTVDCSPYPKRKIEK